MDMQNPAVNAKKEKRNAILITIAVVVVAACIIGLVVYNNLADSGYFLRKNIAAESENFTVNGSMMTYFFYSNYNQYAATFEAYMGLDTSISLKSQTLSEDDTTTWFEYFAAMSENYVGELLALCECAKAAGMELDEADKAAIDANIQSLTDVASQYGYTLDTYLMAAFGSGVKQDDVRDCLELSALAAKYYTEFYNGLSYTEEEYDAYYEANKTSFQAVDLITCTVKQDDFIEKDADGNPIGGVSESAAKAKEYADSIAAASSAEEFKTAVLTYYTDVTGLTAEEAQTKLDAGTVEGMSATAGNTASDWAFAADTGDTNVVDAGGGSSYDVYYLTKAAYRSEDPTRSVRHILFTTDTYGEEAEAAAQTLYDEWKATGFDMTAFESYVAQYSEDTGSLATGGLYENVSQGEMVTEFDAWLFDSSRKTGDTGMVNTTYGTHIMYYAGEGMPAWRVEADAALRSEDYTALITENSGSITFNQEVVLSINA